MIEEMKFPSEIANIYLPAFLNYVYSTLKQYVDGCDDDTDDLEEMSRDILRMIEHISEAAGKDTFIKASKLRHLYHQAVKERNELAKALNNIWTEYPEKDLGQTRRLIIDNVLNLSTWKE